jgi:hypothetical protein
MVGNPKPDEAHRRQRVEFAASNGLPHTPRLPEVSHANFPVPDRRGELLSEGTACPSHRELVSERHTIFRSD